MYSQKINGSHSAEMLEKAGLPWAACRCPLPSDFRLPLEPHLAVVSSKASSSPSDTSLHLSFPQIVLSQHHHVFNLLLWPRILYSLSSTHFLFMWPISLLAMMKKPDRDTFRKEGHILALGFSVFFFCAWLAWFMAIRPEINETEALECACWWRKAVTSRQAGDKQLRVIERQRSGTRHIFPGHAPSGLLPPSSSTACAGPLPKDLPQNWIHEWANALLKARLHMLLLAQGLASEYCLFWRVSSIETSYEKCYTVDPD